MFFNISVYLMDLLMDSCANGLPYGFAYGFWQNRFDLRYGFKQHKIVIAYPMDLGYGFIL